MPKNTQGGKKQRRGKNEGDHNKREIVLKVAGEAYAAVIGPLGQNQMNLRLEDMTTSRGMIRGAIRKKQWINPGDVVRVQLRSGYEEGTVDIVGKYTADEAKELMRLGEVSAAMVQGQSARDESTRAGATAIKFVQASGADDAAAKAAQAQAAGDANNRKRNVDGLADLKALMAERSKAGRGIEMGEDDDEGDQQMVGRSNKKGAAPQKAKWSKNKQQDNDDEEDEELEEGEEDEEYEEGEEEAEEEEAEDEDGAANAASNYDDSRGAASADWNAHHHHKKDQEYKQRNKRAGQQGKGPGAAGGVKAEDVDDI